MELHPGRYTIKFNNDDGKKNTVLPLGGKNKVVISTIAFNRIYKEWDGTAKTLLASDFAQCLRELRTHNILLYELRGVNPIVTNACYDWLDRHEALVNQFAIQHQQKVIATAKQDKEPVKRHAITLEDQFAMTAMSKLVDTLSSPDTIAIRAYAIARSMLKVKDGILTVDEDSSTTENCWDKA